MLFLSFFLGACILQLCCFYTWNRFINKKVDFKSLKTYFIIISLSLISTILNFFVTIYLKMILIAFIMVLVYYFLIYKKINYAIISVFLVQFLFMIVEGVFVFVVAGILEIEMEKIASNFVGSFLINAVITFISFLIIKTGIMDKLFNQILKITTCIHNNKMSKYTIWMLIFSVFLTNLSYSKVSYEYFLIISIMIIIIYFFAIYRMAESQNKFQQLNTEYFKTKKSFEEYEQMMDKYHMMSHELKNEFRTIRAMIINKESNIEKYIDLVIREKINDQEKLMRKLYKISNEFLRGTLYSEFLKMENLQLKYNIHISKGLKASDFMKLDDELSFDIGNILSIFLDNAIDCVTKIEEGNIFIDIYKQENVLIIEISNNYVDELDINMISKTRYTTKGKGHGYGLALANELIENNDSIHNERQIGKDIFTQILKIKM